MPDDITPHPIDAMATVSVVSVHRTNEHGQQYRDMGAPVVLFRSVSPDEWEHIKATGTISGGLNRFNAWDRRREVFFGDTLNAKLIGQGEDVTRRGEYFVQQTPLAAELKEAVAVVSGLLNERKVRSEELGYTLETTPGFLHRTDAVLKAIAQKTKHANSEVTRLREEGRTAIHTRIRTLRSEDDERGYSSVVLETRPITGGRVYSGKDSGMGADDEYGFDSGAVKASDITRIRYVSRGQVSRDEHYIADGKNMIDQNQKGEHGTASVETIAAAEHVQNVLHAEQVNVFVAGRVPLDKRDSMLFVADQAHAKHRVGFSLADQPEKYLLAGGLEVDELDELFKSAGGRRAETNVRQAATQWANGQKPAEPIQIPLFVEQAIATPVTAKQAEEVAKALRSGRVRSFAEAGTIRPVSSPAPGKTARR